MQTWCLFSSKHKVITIHPLSDACGHKTLKNNTLKMSNCNFCGQAQLARSQTCHKWSHLHVLCGFPSHQVQSQYSSTTAVASFISLWMHDTWYHFWQFSHPSHLMFLSPVAPGGSTSHRYYTFPPPLSLAPLLTRSLSCSAKLRFFGFVPCFVLFLCPRPWWLEVLCLYCHPCKSRDPLPPFPVVLWFSCGLS